MELLGTCYLAIYSTRMCYSALACRTPFQQLGFFTVSECLGGKTHCYALRFPIQAPGDLN